jgi:hypothetical protein
VSATDAVSNALGEERTETTTSEPFTVDNTPPGITSFDARLSGGAIEVSGRAEDAASPIARIEVSVNDADWRAVTPEAGLADERALAFRARVPDPPAGELTVAVRVVDLAGNSALRSVRVAGGSRR